MQYTRWDHRKKIEDEYLSALRSLAKKIVKGLHGITEPEDIKRALFAMTVYKPFVDFAQKAALTMVTGLFSDNAKTWRQAARAGMRGAEIYEKLKSEMDGPIGDFFRLKVEENAKLITKLPENISREITRIVADRTIEGLRPDDIAAEIVERVPEISRARADLIARTEVGKTNTAITEARSRDIGVYWYVWRTMEDSRVRDSHAHMEGVLVNFNDPPSPEALIGRKSVGRYNAGEIYNCRCYPEPIVDLSMIRFPAKVYIGGQITRMTKKDFEALGGTR